jgi:hypothetical protein
MEKGYKNIIEPSAPLKSEYRKPGRKDIFKNTPKQRWINPLTEAMKVRYVPNSNLQYLKPIPALPPSYKARLTDTDSAKANLEVMDRLAAKKQKWVEKNILKLKFDDHVKGMLSDVPNSKRVYKLPDELIPVKNEIAVQTTSSHLETEIDHGLHKSSLLRDVKRPETIRRMSLSMDREYLSLPEQRADSPSDEKARKDKYATRNVRYMLEIWQKAEGLDLDIIAREDIEKETEKRVLARRKSIALATEDLKKFEDTEYVSDLKRRNSVVQEELMESKHLTFKEKLSLRVAKNENTDTKPLADEQSDVSLKREESVIAAKAYASPPKAPKTLTTATMKVLQKLTNDDSRATRLTFQNQ